MKYRVELPLAGSLIVCIEAGNKEEAIEKALGLEWRALASYVPPFAADVSGLWIEELETYRRLVEGNVVHCGITEAHAVEE